jgi:hypothetical protein
MGPLEEIASASGDELRGYLRGALHDGCYSRAHGTFRISQKGSEWVELLADIIGRLGARAWVYRETGRKVHVVETCLDLRSAPLVTSAARCGYVRGFFDAEGGIPRDPTCRFYIQLVQKDRAELEHLKRVVESQGIATGALHNPSVRIDPNCWRFYIPARSQVDFARCIGSWHPIKRPLMDIFLNGTGTNRAQQPFGLMADFR